MDRRKFLKAVSAFAGLGFALPEAAELATSGPLLLEGARTNEFDVSPEFDNAAWTRYEHDLLYGTGRAEPRGIMNDFASELDAGFLTREDL